jgi:hypothetical protein
MLTALHARRGAVERLDVGYARWCFKSRRFSNNLTRLVAKAIQQQGVSGWAAETALHTMVHVSASHRYVRLARHCDCNPADATAAENWKHLNAEATARTHFMPNRGNAEFKSLG